MGEHAWQGVCVADEHVLQGDMCGRGCVWQGGMCGRGWGHAWQGVYMAEGHAWQGRQPLQQAVRILLECILVFNYIHFAIRHCLLLLSGILTFSFRLASKFASLGLSH